MNESSISRTARPPLKSPKDVQINKKTNYIEPKITREKIMISHSLTVFDGFSDEDSLFLEIISRSKLFTDEV